MARGHRELGTFLALNASVDARLVLGTGTPVTAVKHRPDADPPS